MGSSSVLRLIAALALFAIPNIASAKLAVGTKAPAFSATGAHAGQIFAFNLEQALKNGPVVLYFYPKAFTKGCTLEANAFAEAMADFDAAGATVIGLSADDLPTLKRFSIEECREKFAVATASAAVIRAYDVGLQREGHATGLSNRTSYVIGTDGMIKLAYSDKDWRQHVKLSLAKVQELKRRK